MTLVSSLSLVSLTPIINIPSRKILEKVRNGPKGILRGPGKIDSWKKNSKLKISCQTPFKVRRALSITGVTKSLALKMNAMVGFLWGGI
jgi:hypothetical protein